jgi:hypothetical protein
MSVRGDRHAFGAKSRCARSRRRADPTRLWQAPARNGFGRDPRCAPPRRRCRPLGGRLAASARARGCPELQIVLETPPIGRRSTRSPSLAVVEPDRAELARRGAAAREPPRRRRFRASQAAPPFAAIAEARAAARLGLRFPPLPLIPPGRSAQPQSGPSSRAAKPVVSIDAVAAPASLRPPASQARRSRCARPRALRTRAQLDLGACSAESVAEARRP